MFPRNPDGCRLVGKCGGIEIERGGEAFEIGLKALLTEAMGELDMIGDKSDLDEGGDRFPGLISSKFSLIGDRDVGLILFSLS